MRALYIAANNSLERGYFLGDVLVICKVAWLFVQNEPHDRVLLSLHREDPLNWIWGRFIRENLATVIHDCWPKGDQTRQYREWNQRLTSRKVHGVGFDTYRELYPRLDGNVRQKILCGRENGLGRRNVFEYYYFGQQTFLEEPVNTTSFGTDVIDVPVVAKRGRILVAPHEKCQGNRVFSLRFWEQVIQGLLAANLPVVVNDNGAFPPGVRHRLLERTFLPFSQLAAQVASMDVVACGNTGIGWLAGAVGTPLVACEREMVFGEYSYRKCGVRPLKVLIEEPDPQMAREAIIKVYNDEQQRRSPEQTA